MAFATSIWMPPLDLFLIFILTPILLPIAAVVTLGIWIRREGRRKNSEPRRLMSLPVLGVLTASILGAGLLVFFQVPKKLAIVVSQSDLKRIETQPHKLPVPGQRIGVWGVVEAEADPRGGLYIVTATGEDFFDTNYEGLAYRPNPIGSPFGRAYYSLLRLKGDWYWFTANNDW